MSSKLIVLIFSLAFINYAVLAQSSECPLSAVVENWNNTVQTCANQAVNSGGEEMIMRVMGLVNDFFESYNDSMAVAWPSTSGEISDTEKSAAFQAYFCVLGSAVQQAPQLGVIAFDCAQSSSQNDDMNGNSCAMEQQINECFEQQLKKDCADMMNSRKRRSLISAVRR